MDESRKRITNSSGCVTHGGTPTVYPDHYKDGKIHKIIIHIRDYFPQTAEIRGSEALCGYRLHNSSTLDSVVGLHVNADDAAQDANAIEAETGIWVYYKSCELCVSEQTNVLGKDYWEKQPLRDLGQVDL